MANGMITQRYLLPVEMLVVSALVALLAPSDRAGRLAAHGPIAALAALVLVTGAVNYRWYDTNRARSPRWTDQVRRAAITCQIPGRSEVEIRSGPQPYFSLVTVPCHDLNRELWCEPPFCVRIDGPRPTGGRRRRPG